jgi:2'-5' RNA ligase
MKEQVKELKQKLHVKIGLSNENLTSVPHISLLTLRENSNRDNFIIEKTKELVTAFSDFTILVNGAHKIEQTYTADLILRIENEVIHEIQTSLCRSFNFRTPKNFVPHLTIGRGIPKNKFEKIGSDLSDFDLREDFLCNNITILKRKVEISARETKRSVYTKICEVPLNNGIVVKNHVLQTA